MVIDLGLMRVDRQEAKSAQDSAALAGVNGLVPNTNSPTFHPFAGVCAAIQNLKANNAAYSSFSLSQWFDGDGGTVLGDGCDPAKAALTCVPGTRSTYARFVGSTSDGRSTVYIQSGYAVSGDSLDSLSGGGFPDETLPAYTGDSGDASQGGCDQVAVIIAETRGTTLGAPAAASMGTRVRSVARVHVEPPKSPFALLILERAMCQVISNGNNGVAAIDVLGYKVHPGMIHSDSAANSGGSDCNKAVLVGQKVNGIVARKAPDTGDSGQISTVTASNKVDSTANVYGEPNTTAQPLTSGLVTREVVDTIYLDGVRARVSDAAFAWGADNTWGTAAPTSPVSTQPDPSGNPWMVMGCPAAGATVTAAPRVLVKCSNVNSSVTFSDATDIIFTGQLGGGSSDIRMPKARNVYVHGKSGPNANAVNASNLLSMHNGGDGTAACGTNVDGTRARLFIRQGSLEVSTKFIACHTSVIMLGGYNDACLPAGYGTWFPSGKVCDGNTMTGNGVIKMSGSGAADWTAPSLLDDEILAKDIPQADHDDLEDLMFWSETADEQVLGGSGVVHLSGVFVAPNAHPLRLNGTPTWDVLNSQYVVRTLLNNGGGVFTMRPMPSLPVAPPTVTFYLAR